MHYVFFSSNVCVYVYDIYLYIFGWTIGNKATTAHHYQSLCFIEDRQDSCIKHENLVLCGLLFTILYYFLLQMKISK